LAVKNVVRYGDPVLTRKCSTVTDFDDCLKELYDDLVGSMYAAAGIGLAANQIGISKSVAVVDISCGEDPDELFVMVNPEIVSNRGTEREEEGCLSFPGVIEYLDRPIELTVTYQDLDGEKATLDAEGLLARAISHEIDHLNGVTILDRMKGFEKELLKKRLKKVLDGGSWEEMAG
jgi:peptide deformylase